MITLEFVVGKQSLTRIDNEKVVSNSTHIYKCHFAFSDEWNGKEKTATFTRDRITSTELLDSTNSCYIPSKLLKASNGTKLQMGVFGVGNNEIITSTVVDIPVQAGSSTSAALDELGFNIYEQIMQRISEISSGQINPDVVAQVVSNYLEQHPISDEMIYSAIERYFSEHDIPTPTPTPTKTLSSISATKTKTSYNVGDSLNTNDIVVTAHYSDNTTANVTSVSTISTSNVNMSAEGNYNIQVSYTEDGISKSATIAISVAAPIVTPTKTLSSISATKTKTSYDVGETLNTNDIAVTAHYSDGTTANVTSASTINTSNVNMAAEGNYNIQVSYTEDGTTKNATIAISVAAPIVTPTKTLSSITATKTKSTYNVGETLETSDIVITAHYSDSTTANVTSASTITTSNVDMMAEGNYNIEISYTEDGTTKDATIAISVVPVNIIDVGIGNDYLYHTIKGAESAVANGGKIRIHEGTYDEYGIGTSSKAITYEGVDKDTCIVQNGLSDKMYSVFDLCGGNKTVKNLTIHQTHSNPQNPDTPEVGYKAYSVHCDMESCANHKYVVDNCILKNRYFACCGFGTWQDSEIVVKNCDIDLYDTNRDITGTGAYYCHSNTYSDGITGQKISLVNNTIHADQSLAIRIDSSKKANSEMICEFIGNTCSSDLYGSTNDCVRFEQNDYTTLAETSTGNNIPVLNYGVEDEEYTAPEGLKDTGYWFVVYDKTKDKYYAGNYTKPITKGYKTSSTFQLAFTVTASQSGKINGWTSTDGQTWTQVTTNQPTYNATTISTNATGETTAKYAFGNSQYNDDIILVDAWSDSEFSWEY